MKGISTLPSMMAATIFSLSLFSCQKNSSGSPLTHCDPATSFQNQVKPLLTKNCNLSGCHDGNNMPALNDYTTCKDASSQIQNALNRNIMPPNKSLADADKQLILCWISNGSQNN